MKIAFEALGFGQNDNFGGSAIVASKNAAALASRGHDVVYFCTNRKDKKSKLYNYKFQSFWIEIERRHLNRISH